MTINRKCFCCWDFPFLFDFNWPWHTVWACDSHRVVGFLWHFKHSVLEIMLWFFFFFSPDWNCTHTPCLTYDNEFYVHRSHAWHISLSYNDKCGTFHSQIDFFIQWFLSWKNSCQCLLFCSRFARRYMPLSAIKQLENKHCTGCRAPLVHQQCRSSFLTINI